MKIPGRVGYQCSNYYRQLIREGVIIDDYYYINDKNMLSFKFKSQGAGKSKKRAHSSRKVESVRCGRVVHGLSEDDELGDLNLEFYQQEEKNCLPVRADFPDYN